MTSFGATHRRAAGVLTFTALLAAVLFVTAATPAAAGVISVRWDPSSAPDLTGYRVYYGPRPGDRSNMQWVPAPATRTDLVGVADCTIQYIAVRAYDGGLESSVDSNQVKGYPRPTVTSVTPSTIRQGQTQTFTVRGKNFDAGQPGTPGRPPARVRLSNSGLVVTSATVGDCGVMTVTVQAQTNAALGFSSLSVENPDLTYSDPAGRPWVFGVLDNAIEVEARDFAGPAVASTSPPAGADGVPATVTPQVTFTEDVDPKSVSAASVMLLDAQGRVVAPARGWPRAAGAVVTIRPAQSLTANETYQIKVRSGSTGVTDVSGNPMASDFLQTPGFKVVAATAPSEQSLAVVSASPASGQTGVSPKTRQVRITFSHDVRPLWYALSRAELQALFRVTQNGRALQQTNSSPTTINSGKTVVISLGEALQRGLSYASEAGPAGAAAQDALRGAGVDPGVLVNGWATSPPWTVLGAVQSVAAEQTGAEPVVRDLVMTADAATTPAENTGVPVDAQYRITLSEPLAPQALSAAMFRIQRADGRDVPQSGPPRLSEDGLSVIVKPAEPLEPGRNYRLVIRLTDAADSAQSVQIVIPLVTEVSAATQDSTLAVAP